MPTGLQKSSNFKVLESEGLNVDAVYCPQRIEEMNGQLANITREANRRRESNRTRNACVTVRSSPRTSIDAGLFKTSDPNKLTRPALM